MADGDRLIINEAQLVLAEKRTSLAALRTGIAVMALPMTVISVLIVASHYYQLTEGVLFLLIPLLIACTGLGALGVYLVLRSVLRLRHEEAMLAQLKRQNPIIAELMD